MCTVTVEYNKNKREMAMLLSLMRKFGAIVTVLKEDDPKYNPEILKKAEQGRIDHVNGHCVKMEIADLWK